MELKQSTQEKRWFIGFLLILFSLAALMLWQGQACDLANAQCLREHYSQPSRQWAKPTIDEGVRWQELKPIPNERTRLSSKALLGRALFREKRLSSDGSVACESCHSADFGFSELKTVSTGVEGRMGKRNSISLLHLRQHQDFYFWDGRAKTLSEQVLMPISDPNEMNLSLENAMKALQSAGYAERFQQIFQQPISPDTVAEALVSYLQTLKPEFSRFDAFLLGDKSALSDSELRGLHLFRTKARCMNCHFGQMMTDGKLHNLNQTLAGRKWQDLGRYQFSQNLADWGKFKTPSLRNVMKSKPWFHHGLFVNMRGIIAIYNRGMIERLPPNAPDYSRQKNHLDPLIKPLNLTREEREDLLNFLKAL